eukprot:m.25262 g.25262  ORF g.25262 m.25262 type:complete len:101 (+) comp9185_c0_seq1:96-398(+)
MSSQGLQQRLNEEMQREEHITEQRHLDQLASRSRWEDDFQRKAGFIASKHYVKQEQKDNEMRKMVMLEQRREKLKELLANEMEECKAELGVMGLAIADEE